MLLNKALENVHSFLFDRLEVAPINNNTKPTLEPTEDSCTLLPGSLCVSFRYVA